MASTVEELIIKVIAQVDGAKQARAALDDLTASAKEKNAVAKQEKDAAKAVALSLKELAAQAKLADYESRKGNITQTEAIAKLTEIDAAYKRLPLSIVQVANMNGTMYQSTERVKDGFKNLHSTLDNMHATMKNKTAPSMIEFSRIIQDAPFGIMGVGNNITQLTTQMASLSAQGLTTRQILSGMISNLSGPMGMMVAVSAVTTLATVFSKQLSPAVQESWSDINELNNALHDLGKTTDEQRVKFLRMRMAELEGKMADESKPSLIGTGLFAATGGMLGNPYSNGPELNTATEYARIQKEIADSEEKSAVSNGIIAVLKRDIDALEKKRNTTQLVSEVAELTKQITAKQEYLSSITQIEKDEKKNHAARVARIKVEKAIEAPRPGTTMEAVMNAFDWQTRTINPNGPRNQKFRADAEADPKPKVEKEVDIGRQLRDKRRAHEETIRNWREENIVANTAIGSIKAGLSSLVSSQLMVTRTGKNGWDSAWIAMENSAISALTNVGMKLAEEALIGALISDTSAAASVVTATATGAAIAAAYAPAAIAAQIATLGAAGIAGSASTAASAIAQKATLMSMMAFADGGWINEPVYGYGKNSGRPYMFGEQGPEYVNSNKNMTSLMRESRSSGNSNAEVVKAINGISLKFSMSSTRTAVALQGSNRIRQAARY